MNKDILKFALLFIILILFQVLIFNKIAIFNIAFPIIFIYFIIRLPMSLKRSVLISLAFFTGLTIDIFSDTLGVNALSCTILAAVKQPVYYAYVDRDDHTKNLIPSVSTLGIGVYTKFLLSMILIYCVTVFSTEYFNFADVKDIVILSISSTLLTFISLLGTDCLILSDK